MTWRARRGRRLLRPYNLYSAPTHKVSLAIRKYSSFSSRQARVNIFLAVRPCSKSAAPVDK